MMKRRGWTVLAAASLLAVPGVVSAQGLGVAVRGGTLGVGAEAAVNLVGPLVVRGGFGVVPAEISGTVSDVDMTLDFPATYNIGVDLYALGLLRVGAGMMFRDNLTVTGDLTTSVDIGGRMFTPGELGTLTGTFDFGSQAPYVLIGFGKHTSTGFGLSLDLGVAFMKTPEVSLAASGGTFSDLTELTTRLNTEAQSFEDDLPQFLEFWPIASLGVRFGLGLL